MATYVSRTPGSTGNRRTFTFSCWVKKTDATGNIETLFSAGNSNNDTDYFHFDSGDRFTVVLRTGGTTHTEVTAAGTRRDPGSWYHVVLRVDTTQSTASDRVRIYINGEEATYQVTTYPGQNVQCEINDTKLTTVGARSRASVENFFLGYLSEVFFVDGQSYAPTTFGSTNSDGVWVPNTSPSVTYGTNGFRLQFAGSGTSADSSGFGADTSGNNNHLASNSLGTNPNTTDTPQNNFCTLSVIDNQSVALSKGGCDFDSSGGNDEGVRGTMGVLAGKWYYECKITGSAGLSAGNIGFAQPTYKLKNNPRGGQGMFVNGSASLNLFNFSSSGTSLDAGAGVVQNDIIGFALNLTDNQLTVYKNGTQVGSTQTIASGLTSSGEFFLPVIVDDGGSNDVVGSFNFGNPTFTIASSNSDANGYGSFEYAVPSGYYALCTKNLATYG
jgi:hypothetical protein